MLTGKKILIGITGGIAAYKIPLLVRLFKKAGAEVQILFSPMAHEFVTPLTLSTLSGSPVLTDFHNPETGEWNSHVELGMWPDVMLIAPATASTMGKMVNGIADNLLVTTYLSAKCPVVLAPAMDLDMYKHPSTKTNVEKLKEFGHLIIEPKEGELASGLCGEGRMEEPQEIFNIIAGILKKKADLKGKRFLISAGPTYEAIDPVRFIGNHSSGLMGYSLAEEAASRGATVELVSGPTHLSISHPAIKLTKVTTAEEMYRAVTAKFSVADVTIMSAAVADYKPEQVAEQKIKKSSESPKIKLVPTKDILAELGKQKKNSQLLVGFALETNDEISNAEKKLKNKNLDFIVLNSLKDKGAGFGHQTNKVFILDKNKNITHFDLKPKKEVAVDIIDKIVEISAE